MTATGLYWLGEEEEAEVLAIIMEPDVPNLFVDEGNVLNQPYYVTDIMADLGTAVEKLVETAQSKHLQLRITD